MTVRPFHIGVGKQNIRASATGSAAALGRDAREAFQDIIDNFMDFCQHMDDQAPEILREALEPTFELSQTYCPIETGELRESGYLEVESFRGGARCEIGYARGGVPGHAIYVHEMPYKHEAPTRSKFLEAAVDEDFYAIWDRVTKLVGQASGV